jgi:hypothetical protein
LTSRLIGGNDGIPDLTAPICSLIGVFTDGPSSGQAFFMGSSGSVVVPAGAVKLYLGTMDGYGWANNIGAFEVNVHGTPDAGSSLAFLGGAIAMLGAVRRKLNK